MGAIDIHCSRWWCQWCGTSSHTGCSLHAERRGGFTIDTQTPPRHPVLPSTPISRFSETWLVCYIVPQGPELELTTQSRPMFARTRHRDILVLEHDSKYILPRHIWYVIARSRSTHLGRDTSSFESFVHDATVRGPMSGMSRGHADGTAKPCTNIGHHDALHSRLLVY